jgi:hypothetical protein
MCQLEGIVTSSKALCILEPMLQCVELHVIMLCVLHNHISVYVIFERSLSSVSVA